MKTKAHTPGPWVFVGKEIHDQKTLFDESGVRIGNTPNSICEIHPMPSGCHAANARLIAAAPELLEQLKIAVKCLYGLNRFDLDPMKAAIAKAEG